MGLRAVAGARGTRLAGSEEAHRRQRSVILGLERLIRPDQDLGQTPRDRQGARLAIERLEMRLEVDPLDLAEQRLRWPGKRISA